MSKMIRTTHSAQGSAYYRDYLTLTETRERLGVSKAVVRHLIAEGILTVEETPLDRRLKLIRTASVEALARAWAPASRADQALPSVRPPGAPLPDDHQLEEQRRREDTERPADALREMRAHDQRNAGRRPDWRAGHQPARPHGPIPPPPPPSAEAGA